MCFSLTKAEMRSLQPRTCLCGSFLSDLYPRRVYFSHRIFGFQHSLFCQSGGNIASPSHVNHLSGSIKAERLVQNRRNSYARRLFSTLNPISVNTLNLRTQIVSRFGCRHLNFLLPACASQHRRQRCGELRHWERVRGLREQRRGQLRGQVCCALHWQSLHGERHYPGAHQEPAQHDPR